mmetsp:Transcript_107878/g.292507  ORF Transcript_107878/g.292507 Transcript_107878/m.292507 type:complete len:214 (-) Transcript_107878:398-1039(-)
MGLWRRQDCHEVPEHGKAHLSPVGQVVQDPVQVVYAQLEVVPAHAERWQLALVQGEHAEPTDSCALDPNLRADLAQPHQHEGRLGRLHPGSARPKRRPWRSRRHWGQGIARRQRGHWGQRVARRPWSQGPSRPHGSQGSSRLEWAQWWSRRPRAQRGYGSQRSSRSQRGPRSQGGYRSQGGPRSQGGHWSYGEGWAPWTERRQGRKGRHAQAG